MSELPKSVIFSFFGSETWAFSGSSRFVQDISKPFTCFQTGTSNTCPNGKCANPCLSDTDFQNINFNYIESIVEFDTVGLLQKSLDSLSNVSLYIHVDKINPSVNALVQEFSTTITTSSFNLSTPIIINIGPASTAGSNNRLPPSSSMAFLSKKPDISAILISDYQSEYSNQYYNSEFDDGVAWNSQHITLLCGLANKTANSLYKLAGDQETSSTQISANCSLLNEYLDCLTRNTSCQIMQQFLPNSSFNPISSSYSSVFSFDTKPKPLTWLINRILTNLTANSRTGTCRSDLDCPEDNDVCISGNCVTSLTRYHNAYGTNFF